MPLLDHFRPPIDGRLPWRSLFHGWLVRITDVLYERMPSRFVAGEQIRRVGRPYFDVGIHDPSPEERAGWRPPAPHESVPFALPDQFEVHVREEGDPTEPVAVIAFVTPNHKADPSGRRQFADAVSARLRDGACVLVLDVVTTPAGELHSEISAAVGSTVAVPDAPGLYAVTYRPAVRGDRVEIDVWTAAFAVGELLPTMPLRLTGDLFVPIEFEATYVEACRRRRLV